MIDRNDANLVYCLQFLRNGGERIRAVKLACDVIGCSLQDAIMYVDSLHTPVPVCVYEPPKLGCKSCYIQFDVDDPRLAAGMCPICGAALC